MYKIDEQMLGDVATVEFEGKTYTLQSQAEYSNRVFDGWWGDAQGGDEYIAEFSAPAVDDEGIPYEVYWQFTHIRNQEPEDLSNLDWDNIAFIRPQ